MSGNPIPMTKYGFEQETSEIKTVAWYIVVVGSLIKILFCEQQEFLFSEQKSWEISNLVHWISCAKPLLVGGDI